MSMPLIRKEVSSLLDQVEKQVAAAEAKLARGSGADKVRAAGELVSLKRQREILQARLNEIDSDPEATESIWQWLKEDWFNLNRRFQDWIING